MTVELTKAIQATVKKLPGWSRALAIEAEIDPSLLTRIIHGKRTATPEVAKALENALRRWAEHCEEGAKLIATANKSQRRAK